jgi:hypothetical protein
MANIVRFRLRSDTGANWTSKNPVLLRGEPGFDETERRFKMGDGVKKWNELPYEKDPDVVNALNSDRVDAALSAAQGRALKTMVDAKAGKNEIPAPVPIVNDLTTGGTNKALSAEQGKALKTMVDSLDNDIPKYSITGFDANNEPTGFSIVGGASYTITRDGGGKLTRITSGNKTWTARYDAQGRFSGLS